MKNHILFLFLIISSIVFAQSSKNVEKGLFKINALFPGFSYELGTGKNTSLDFGLMLVPVTSNGVVSDNIELFPTIVAEFRYYVNMNHRFEQGKSISRNTGNYVSFLNQVLVTAPILGNLEYDEPISYNGGFVYGLQRTYTKGFYFSIAGGLGFFAGDNDPTAGLLVDARLGWVLGASNK